MRKTLEQLGAERALAARQARAAGPTSGEGASKAFYASERFRRAAERARRWGRDGG